MKPRDAKDFERTRKIAAAVLNKRRPWEQHWQDIADHLYPYSVQIVGRRDGNKAAREDKNIINDAPCRSHEACSAGLMANITSPSLKWFGMEITNRGIATAPTDIDSDARSYLDAVTAIIASELQRGGWYATLSGSTYADVTGLGNAAIFMDEQPDGLVVFDGVPVGRFAIDTDHLGKVNTWVREWSATAEQICERFCKTDADRAKLPERIRDALNRQDVTTQFDVLHAVLPLKKPTPQGFKWSSTWWLADSTTNEVLGEGGFYEFPALVPRWSVRKGDIYGRGPGSKALGNIRMLQHYSRGSIGLLDRRLDPPQWSTNATALSYLPGTTTHIAAKPGEKPEVGRVTDVRAEDITVADAKIEQLKRDVDETFFGPLWKTFTDEERSNITATEILERRQERALRMGPILESFNGELFEPAIERLYAILSRRGALPPLPESLQGEEIRIEFMSIMHKLQKATEAVGTRSFMADVQMVAATHPEVIDKIDADEVVEEMARANGIKSDMLVSGEELQAVRASKAQQQQQQQQTEQGLAFTKGLSDVSRVDPKQLTELANTLAPAAAAQASALGDL
jgi:hypothetical protein